MTGFGVSPFNQDARSHFAEASDLSPLSRPGPQAYNGQSLIHFAFHRGRSFRRRSYGLGWRYRNRQRPLLTIFFLKLGLALLPRGLLKVRI